MNFTSENVKVTERFFLSKKRENRKTVTILASTFAVEIHYQTHHFHNSHWSLDQALEKRDMILKGEKVEQCWIKRDDEGYYRVWIRVGMWSFHTEKLNLATAISIKDGVTKTPGATI